jgi:hypothetical protein
MTTFELEHVCVFITISKTAQGDIQIERALSARAAIR